jgi:ArsR family transcriptional regulator
MAKKKMVSIQDKKIQEDRETFALLCKALCHPTRVKIIQYLKQVDQCICGTIVDILPLSQSTVSQHLKVLKEADLIRGVIDGPRTSYCLNKEIFNQFKKMAAEL